MEKPLDLPRLLRTIDYLLCEPVEHRLSRLAGKHPDHALHSCGGESVTFLLSCLILFSRNVFCRRPDLGASRISGTHARLIRGHSMTSKDASKKK